MRSFGFDFKSDKNVQVVAMKKALQKFDGKIEFSIEQYPDGSWTAESVNIDGIITGGKTTQNASSVIKDAVFTYFEIPPHLCTDSLLRGDNEPITLTQRMYV